MRFVPAAATSSDALSTNTVGSIVQERTACANDAPVKFADAIRSYSGNIERCTIDQHRRVDCAGAYRVRE